ncbi:MAG: hypothetical protein R8P61_05740 [Bacteroidia bacterium]|nr:hypothetical protein [Bacteroidia bacterium]
MKTLTKEAAIQRGNQYFNDLYNARACSDQFYVLENTVHEHDLCFSMAWHLVKEKHLPSSRWSSIVGGGPLFISKISSHIGLAGSGLYYDGVGDFEL